MDDVISCQCRQHFTTEHERCPYCANPVQRFWYRGSGSPRSAIATRIEGGAAYITEHGLLVSSADELPAALRRVDSIQNAMLRVTGGKTQSRRSVGSFLGGTPGNTVVRNIALPLTTVVVGVGVSLALFAPLLDALGASWASHFIVWSTSTSIAGLLLLFGLAMPFVLWSGGSLSFNAERYASSKQPSRWDSWLS